MTARAPAPPPTAVLPAVADGAPARPRRRRWPLAALLAVLLLAAGAGVLALSLRDDPTPATDRATEQEAAPTTPTGVDVVAADLLGRPVQEVEDELVGRGLRVELVAVETGEVAAGLVAAVDPTGTLAPDAVVRLSYATTPPPPPAPAPAPSDGDEADDEDGKDRGNGRGKGRDRDD